MAVTREQLRHYQALAKTYLNRAGIVLTPQEEANIEIADLGLGEFETTGLALVTYINTPRCCAKELVLLPGQTCPEHFHPPIPELNYEGKEETFRCRWGTVYLYVEGEPTPNPKAKPPAPPAPPDTHRDEIGLKPGGPYTLPPQTRHGFQGGPEGAVVSEFSTRSVDEADLFTDPEIRRMPEVKD